MSNKDIKFPYYSGNIKFAKCMGHCSLEYFIKAHKNPNPRTRRILEEIKVADSNQDKAAKRALKHQLFSFTPSVYVRKGFKRKYENVILYTGLMQLDFDKLRDKQEAIDLKNHIFKNYKHIITAYLSPSGLGVKCIMRIKKPKSKDQYKALHKAIMLEFEQYDCFDKATTNAMLPLFLSWDPKILYRDYEDCFEWNEEDWNEPEYVELNETPNNFNTSYRSDESEYSKTVRIFTNKVDNIIDNGHTQLRSACLILGSRAGAGYINSNEAKMIAEMCINRNSYLQKDLNNYKSTALWAVDEGFKNPKYYK